MSSLPTWLDKIPDQSGIFLFNMTVDEWFEQQNSDDSMVGYMTWLTQQKHDLEKSYRQWGQTLDSLFTQQRAYQPRPRTHARDTVIYTHD